LRFNLGLDSESSGFSDSGLCFSETEFGAAFSSITGFGGAGACVLLGACADGGVLGVAGFSAAGGF